MVRLGVQFLTGYGGGALAAKICAPLIPMGVGFAVAAWIVLAAAAVALSIVAFEKPA